MRKILFATILVGVFFSCKKEAETIVVSDEKKLVEGPVSEVCYIGVFNKDTVSIHLILKKSKEVTGNLTYSLFEKDKNQGTFSGAFKGDTLIADYTFNSEGISSVRRVAFLKKDTVLIEGFGGVVDNDGKMTFTDIRKLQFDTKRVLSKVSCREVTSEE